MKVSNVRRFLHRGGKFTLLDVLWILLLVVIFTTLVWQRPLEGYEALYFVFAFIVPMIVPLGLKTGFVQRKSNLDSPYESSLRRLRALGSVSRAVAILGLVFIIFKIEYTAVVLVGLVFTFLLVAAVFALDYVKQLRRYRPWLADFLHGHAPAFALHTPRTDGGSYQVHMWLEPLESLGRNFIIIVRSADALVSLEAITSQPVLVCETWADLDQVLTPNIRAVFYVNSVGANADLLTYRTAKHVYLGHGDSEKPLSVHPLHAAFDYIAVAGQAAIDRYAKAGLVIPEEKFVRVGRPQTATTTKRFTQDSFKTHKISVVYAPTWKGYNALSSYSSLASGKELVTRLVEADYRVVFRPHPFSLQRSSELRLCNEITEYLETQNSRSSTLHLFGSDLNDANFPEIMHLGDVLIADRSSVIIDFLSTGKPIAEMEFPETALQTESDADVSYTYRVSRCLDNLESTLQVMLGADPLKNVRHEAAKHYLSIDSDPAEKFRSAVDFLLAH